MRICVLSDCVFPTPTPDGHGLGLMAWQVAEGLYGRGHDVSLIAKEGSQFSGALYGVPGATGYEGEMLLAKAALRLHRQFPFDVFLDNGHLHLLADLFPNLPVVNVYHDRYQNPTRCMVLLSEGQLMMMDPVFETARIIPNALNPEAFAPQYDPYEQPFALFIGALSEIKQPVLAIEAAARAGVKLILAGKEIIGRFPVGDYTNVEAVGSIGGAKKHWYLRHARVFLQLGVGESFGLTTLEAGLCGTPVVAWPTGGSLNLIQYGANGVFITPSSDSVGAIVDAMRRAWDMDRHIVRQATEALCDIDRQITAYEDTLADCMQGVWW